MAKVLDDILGSIEALTAMGSGAIAAPVAGGIGLAKGIRKGYGTREGTDEAQRAAGEALDAMMYRPRTAAGQSQLEAVANLLDRAKIPPFVPGVGAIRKPGPGAVRQAAGAVAEVVGPKLEQYMQGTGMQLNAVKEPGGHFAPAVGTYLSTLLANNAPPHIQEWADRAIPRYIGRQLGTSKDPANRLPLAGGTYENAMDKLLRRGEVDLQGEDPGMIPPNSRQGEPFWHMQHGGGRDVRGPFEQFMQHAGDFAQTIPAEDLARMDVPALLLATAKADARGLKQKSKSGDARMEAALRLTNEHPPGDVIAESELGKWLRFTKGQDPEYVKQGLSVDTCFGDHCVAGVAHGKPEWGYPGWVPARDIVTGRPVRPDMRDSTSYITNLLEGKGDILSLRTPEGMPAATMELRVPPNQYVSRSHVRDQLLGKPAYLAWQRAQRQAGVPLEQDAPPIPGAIYNPGSVLEVPNFMNMSRADLGNAKIGGGKISPDRGPLGPEQIRTMSEMYPQYADRLAHLLANPPQDIGQLKGYKNGPMSPKYQDFTRDMLNNQANLQYLRASGTGMGEGDLTASGLYTRNGTVSNAMDVVRRLKENPAGLDHETKAHINLIESLLREDKIDPRMAGPLRSSNSFMRRRGNEGQ